MSRCCSATSSASRPSRRSGTPKRSASSSRAISSWPRAIVARYGGVVEKFIGDAVMAVWGAPVAKEDDAERAVRAGLELVSAVAAYGSEHGTELQARVGIVTGGAATTRRAEEGLVIGDRVNTAARIQSAAPPGCCYVDETTTGGHRGRDRLHRCRRAQPEGQGRARPPLPGNPRRRGGRRLAAFRSDRGALHRTATTSFVS